MICVLKERDGWLYVVQVDTLSSSPEVLQRWFPTGVRASVAHEQLGDFENVQVVRDATSPGRYVLPPNIFGTRAYVTLEHRGETQPSHVATLPVPKPKTRLKGRVYWELGEWWIRGTKGERLLATVNLHEYLT